MASGSRTGLPRPRGRARVNGERRFDAIWLVAAVAGFCVWLVADALERVSAAHRRRDRALTTVETQFVALREGGMRSADLAGVREAELFGPLEVVAKTDEFGVHLVLVPGEPTR